MKKLITMMTTVLFLICFSTVSAQADRKTMEGFMLGTGAAILGAAIINGMNDNDRPQYSRHHSPPPEVYIEYRGGHRDRHHWGRHDRRHHGPDGHWEIVRVWVEPVSERRWNPAHYNHRGEWVEGRYESFEISGGYYQDQRVWVGR